MTIDLHVPHGVQQKFRGLLHREKRNLRLQRRRWRKRADADAKVAAMREELNRRVRLPVHVRERMAERAWAARRRGELPEEEVDAANEVELLL